jgi:hypothetical protein
VGRRLGSHGQLDPVDELCIVAGLLPRGFQIGVIRRTSGLGCGCLSSGDTSGSKHCPQCSASYLLAGHVAIISAADPNSITHRVPALTRWGPPLCGRLSDCGQPQRVSAGFAEFLFSVYFEVSASIAAFSITALGALSSVKISNCLAACSRNMEIPGITVAPCDLARRTSSVSSGL